MGATRSAGRTVLRVALILISVCVVGYFALMALVFYGLQEPYPYLDVENHSGRPLLLERDTAMSSPSSVGHGVLVWGNDRNWPAGSHQCEQDRLVARDLHGMVVARRTGACRSDTWTITGEGMSAAPTYQRGAVPSDLVEVRLVVDRYQRDEPVAAWWRALPRTLERAAATGRAAGVSVHGPFVEDQNLAMYVRGSDAATVLEFARTQVLRPSPGRVYAYVSAPGEPAPQTGTPVLLELTTDPTSRTR